MHLTTVQDNNMQQMIHKCCVLLGKKFGSFDRGLFFTRLFVFDSAKGSSNTFKTHKNISLYFKRRYLITYNYFHLDDSKDSLRVETDKLLTSYEIFCSIWFLVLC